MPKTMPTISFMFHKVDEWLKELIASAPYYFQDDPGSIGFCPSGHTLSPTIPSPFASLSLSLPFFFLGHFVYLCVNVPNYLCPSSLLLTFWDFSTPTLSIFFSLPYALWSLFFIFPFSLCTSSSHSLTAQAHPFSSVPLPITYLAIILTWSTFYLLCLLIKVLYSLFLINLSFIWLPFIAVAYFKQ